MRKTGPTDRNTTSLRKFLSPRLHLFIALILLSFLGLQIVEASHLHQTVALERDCPVCQASGHQSLDLPPPPLAPSSAILFLLFFLSGWQPVFRVVSRPFARPNSRAPPASALSQ